jgi:hypothetical protein
MTSLSKEVQYMDCSQHNRPLFLMISNGLEDRQYLDNVGLVPVSNYTVIFNLLVNTTKFSGIKRRGVKSALKCKIFAQIILVGTERLPCPATIIYK